MKVFYTTYDCGDGSNTVRFFDSQECISLLEDHDPEGYGCGEGGGSFDVHGEISGITIRTLDQVKASIIDED